MKENENDWTKGINFWKWLFTPMNCCIMALYLIFTTVTICTYDEFSEPWMFWAFLGFIQLMGGVFTFGTWQHWNDLKHGRSR